MQFTKNEFNVLKACENKGDLPWQAFDEANWRSNMEKKCGLRWKSIEPIIRKLFKAGFVWTNGDTFWRTQKGITACKDPE